MNQETNWNRFAGVIGIIASCIAIFVFLTGWESIWAIIQKSQQPSQPTAISTTITNSEVTRAIALPADTNVKLPTSTPRPANFQLIESGDNYKIEHALTGHTEVEVILDHPKGFPLDEQALEVQSVVKDIAGDWQYSGYSVARLHFAPESMSEVELTSGDWALVQGTAIRTNNIRGFWGNAMIGPYDKHGLIFHVDDGYTTRVTILIGRLEIGVLDPAKNVALVNQYVWIACQSADIAGNIITDTNCDNEHGVDVSVEETDATGIATFFVAGGRYIICSEEHLEENCTYDIVLSPGEDKRVTINFLNP